MEEKKEFEIQTHYWDSKSRKLSHKNPYRMWHVRGVQYWERPVGSGNLYTKDGAPCGRIVDFTKCIIDKNAKHIDWERPKTEEELRDIKFNELEAKNKELLRELDMIKKEKYYAAVEKSASKKAESKKER